MAGAGARGRMTLLAGFILVPYGMIGTFRATELLRKDRLPQFDCALLAMLGLMLAMGGLGLLLVAPAAFVVVPLLLARRGLLIYNARLLRGRVRRRDLWPGAWPDVALTTLIVLGTL